MHFPGMIVVMPSKKHSKPRLVSRKGSRPLGRNKGFIGSDKYPATTRYQPNPVVSTPFPRRERTPRACAHNLSDLIRCESKTLQTIMAGWTLFHHSASSGQRPVCHFHYFRHADTTVYVSPTMMLTNNSSIIPGISASHLVFHIIMCGLVTEDSILVS